MQNSGRQRGDEAFLTPPGHLPASETIESELFMMEEFRVSAVQMDVRLGEKDANLERMDSFARLAVSEGAALVVFPECSLTGYCFESREEGSEFAEPVGGPAVESMTGLCRELDILTVFGFLESEGDSLYNSLALVGPDGLLGSYRKAHLPHLGIDHFVDRGDNLTTVHETPLCRLGMNICYDGAFPESARLLALAGADLVVLPPRVALLPLPPRLWRNPAWRARSPWCRA